MSNVNLLSYNRPRSLAHALERLGRLDAPAYLVAGGTDFVPRMRRPNIPPRSVVDISGLRMELGGIALREDGIHIGSMATHTEICSSTLVLRRAPVLAEACRSIGSLQIRNRGTLGGNIANASPAGDSMPALLVLGAQICLESANGRRTLSLAEFVTGPSQTSLKKEELITEIVIPLQRLDCRGWYKKLSTRNAVTISLVSAAIAAAGDGSLRLAFGSVAPVPISFPEVEAQYSRTGDLEALIRGVGRAVSPISDVRASAEYRREMCMNLVREGLCVLGIMSYERGAR